VSSEVRFLDRPAAQWVQDLSSATPRVRRSACFVLGELGLEAAPFVPQLNRALKDTDPTVRDAAALALGDIALVHPFLPDDVRDAVPVLLELLQRDPAVACRRSAAYALGALAAVGAEPLLRERLAEDDAPAVRQNAAWALGKLSSPLEPQTLRTLDRALQDMDALVRRDAAQALEAIKRERQR
jgi:HEAT repeat protein